MDRRPLAVHGSRRRREDRRHRCGLAVMLGSVGFDGSPGRAPGGTCSPTSRRRTYSTTRSGRARGDRLQPARTDACVLAVGLAYIARPCGGARTAPRRKPRAAVRFSLVPIALVYAVAHYFSLLVVQGQFVLPLASDPFGSGWDLLGSIGDYRPNLALSRRTRSGTYRSARSSRATSPGSRSRTTAPDAVPRAGRGAALPVRDARADGRVHGRGDVAPVAELVVPRRRLRRDRRDADRRRHRGVLRRRLAPRAPPHRPPELSRGAPDDRR